MSALAARIDGFTSATRTVTDRLERVRPGYVLSILVVAEWLVTLALFSTIRHNGWLFYHGGDQTYFYTTSRLLLHGELVPTSVGYGWSMVLLPFSAIAGPDLLNALPAVILLNVLVLMPLAMLAIYGIAERIGGRIFGYWTTFLWIVIPLVGILYTDTGFKARYSEQGLPDAFGLTSLSDFPQMVALVCSAYFVLRAIERATWGDGLLAGALAGCAVGIKPSASIFFVAFVLAVVGGRAFRMLLPFVVGIAPFLVALMVWKWRGLGYLPLFHSGHGLSSLASAAPLAVLDLHKYLYLNWSELGHSLGSLREHFWSERVVEWIVFAGVIGLARRSFAACLLVGGWFFAFLIVKGTGPFGTLEDGSLLHKLVPAIPAFVLIVAAVPLLLPRVPRMLRTQPLAGSWGSARMRGVLLAVLIAVFAIVPSALAGASTVTPAYGQGDTGPIPWNAFPLTATRIGKHLVRLSWPAQKPWGARPYYLVLRGALGLCGAPIPVYQDTCFFAIAGTHKTTYLDRPPKVWQQYWIVVGANWLNDTINGEDYVLSRAATWRPGGP